MKSAASKFSMGEGLRAWSQGESLHYVRTARYFWTMFPPKSPYASPLAPPLGGILALRAHYALLLDYVPPEEPLGTPLGNTLRIR